MDKQSKQQLIQESQYIFPYHFIPYDSDGVWVVSRYLWWGYEYLAVLETIISLVRNHHPKKILDFGCGDGRLISELCRNGIGEIVGVDISERALLFSQVMVGYNDKVRYFRSQTEIRQEQFDAIIGMDVLEHIPPDQTKSVLRDIYKVLVDNGVFIISVPTTNIPLHSKHYRHFTIYEIEQDIAGLFVVDKIYFIHKVGTLANILRRAVVNKFFMPTWPPWLKLTTSLYRQYIMKAQESNGAHLIAVLRKADKDVLCIK